MKTKFRLGVIFAAIAAATTFAAHAQVGSGGSYPSNSPSSGATSTSAPGADMSKLDTNKDGSISKSEARKDKELSKAFDSLDTNKDGKLDASEFAAYGGSGSSAGSAKP